MLRQKHEPEARNEVRYELQKQIPTQGTTSREIRRQRAGKQSALNQWATQKMGAQNTRLPWVILPCLLSFLLSLPTMVLLSNMYPSHSTLGFAVGAAMMFGGLIGMTITLITTVWKQARAASREPMPQEEGVQAIGPLLDRLMTSFLDRSEMYKRLIELLPRLQPEDTSLLEPRHYEILNGYLHQRVYRPHRWAIGEDAFLLAVLDAYSRIGDPRALPDVMRIAQGKAAYDLRDPEVRAAAQRCLPYLERAAEALQQKETLLRLSEAPIAQETLLRPAAPASVTDSNHLLRPTDAEENT
ncbi:MAG TPA: hypothetical protein VKU00_23155 [Chthonomonadaceae bacterium]|nr:hypothetical protein [Chthonomonadaceae bacterium]